MERKIVSRIMLTLLLISIVTLAFNVQPVKASGTIYIRPNGSIDPPTAPIQRDGNVYTFTDNIYDSIVVERDNIVVDGAGYTVQGTVAPFSKGISLSGRSNVTVKNMEVKAFESGIYLCYSSNNSISGNNITNNRDGIELFSSSNNTIHGNNITNNWPGIFLWYSSNNSILGNNITNNIQGIILYRTSNNVLRDNSIANNKYNFWVGSENLSDFVNDVDVSNTVDGKPIYYWISKQDMTVSPDPGYVALVNCTRITVQNLNLTSNGQGLLLAYTTNSTITKNNLTNNYHGIELLYSSSNSIFGNNIKNSYYGTRLWYSSSNIISGNNIKNSYYGIWSKVSSNIISGNNITANNYSGINLWASSSNTIFGNNIKNSYYGIWLEGSSNNKFYHNNFIDNTQGHVYVVYILSNIWDNGYPSGGNYWSDYTGDDLYSGPYQNETGSDGIWDNPYEIDANNNDNYPLVEPWTPLPRTIGELKTEIEELGSEDEIDNQGVVKSFIAKLNVAQKLVDKGKVDEAKTILEDDFIPQVQNLSGIHITVEAADILIQSAEHILSHI